MSKTKWGHRVSRHRPSLCGVALAVALAVVGCGRAYAQAGFDDPRVMMQGFYWESYRHGHPDRFPSLGNLRWYEIVRSQTDAIREARFDLLWLPPPTYAGEWSAGYDPRELFRLDNSYGSMEQHRALLESLLHAGIEPIADIVVNHRNGSERWADFRNPTWGTWAITRDDEAFSNASSEVTGTPESERGAPEEATSSYAAQRPGTYAYDAFRDLDHTNAQVHHDIARYLLQLKSLGYRGWRYDMVHGYHARWVAYYNRVTQPTFSVGEYDWGAHNEQRGWMWNTATSTDASSGDARLRTASSVFDFSTFFTLKGNKGAGRYFAWYGYGNGIGMVGDTTDDLAWKNRAVTFVENHDTGYRTDEDGTPQKDHLFDSFANTWEVEQAYAQILTHPGVPCVYWKHYFEWGSDLRAKLAALINARKVAGVHAGSALHLQENARMRGVYAARVDGHRGPLYVRIGGSDDEWQPSVSGYQDYREYAAGAGWKVWIALPGNPEVRQAPLAAALPVPTYHSAVEITLPAEAD